MGIQNIIIHEVRRTKDGAPLITNGFVAQSYS